MRSVEWSDKALADYDGPINFIALDSRRNASLVADRIEAAIALLQTAPTGRFGRIQETYEKFVSKTSLIIAYQVDAHGNISIARIIHAARDWPEGRWPDE
jgi:plasmid stabilization system protein ParE